MGRLVVTLTVAACLSIAGALHARVGVVADEDPPADYSISFPSDWAVERLDGLAGTTALDAAAAGSSVDVLLRATSPGGSERCDLVDLTRVAEVLLPLGVDEPMSFNYVAADVLRETDVRVTSSGWGPHESWSAWMEGTAADGREFAIYGYLGRDAWPGLEDVWYVLDCSSAETFHQDWRAIADTFEFVAPAEILDSLGPVVIGGRIELPDAGYALEVPEGWVAVDLTHPDHVATLRSLGSDVAWFGEQLTGSFGEVLAGRATDGSDVVLWSWLSEDGPYWHESCELIEQASSWDSVDELVEVYGQSFADDRELAPNHNWGHVELPAGTAARHDFRWSPTIVGSEFIFLRGDRSVTLMCQNTDQAEGDDVAAMRARWLTIAESFSLPEVPEPPEETGPVDVLA